LIDHRTGEIGKASHGLMVSHPDALTKLIKQAAASTESASEPFSDEADGRLVGGRVVSKDSNRFAANGHDTSQEKVACGTHERLFALACTTQR